MDKKRLLGLEIPVLMTVRLLLVMLIGMAATAHADEPEETIPVNLSVDVRWDMDEGRNIRKGHFRMNAKTTLNLDRTGSGLDHEPKLTPFSLKYKGRTFTGSLHFEETLTQKKPQPPDCPPLLESYSGSRSFSYSPPKDYDSINLLFRRFGIAKSRLKSKVSGMGEQQFLAQLQSQMGIPSSYYEFVAGGISGKHTIYGKKRKTVNGRCRYEKAEKQVFMSVVGLRFPIPEKGPIEGKQAWRAKLDGPPRNFSIKLSQTGVGKEKPFRPENAGSGGNATYTISWTFKEVSPELKIRLLKEGQWVDVTGETQTIVVGEQIRLDALAITDSGDMQQGQWSIPGKTIKNFIVTHEGNNISGKAVTLKEEDLKNPEITFYWWDRSKKSLSVNYTATVQGKAMTAETQFDVKEPDIRVRTEIPPGAWVIQNTPDYDPQNQACKDYINLFYDPTDQGKDFSIKFSHSPLPAQFPGDTQYVQIVKRTYQYERTQGGNCQEDKDLMGIDTTYPYAKGPETVDNPGAPMPYKCLRMGKVKIGNKLYDACEQFDTNTDSDYRIKFLTENDFEMILMFKPDKPQSIFVPLRVIDWSWKADLHREADTDPWNWDGSSIKVTKNTEAEKFPEWNHVSPEELKLKYCKCKDGN
jgi:hypothetical protein